VISRIFADRRRVAILRHVDRPAAILLAIAQALVATAGWFAEPLWLAVAIAGQLVLGGIVAVRVIGPMRSDLGLARYAVPAAAGIAATLFGRLIPGGLSLLLVPILAVLLWSVTYLELRIERGIGGQTIGRLLLTVILFAGATGILFLFGPRAWPTPLVLVVGLALPLALRSSEARGTMGVEGLGQALLHVLVVAQIGAATLVLNIPLAVMAGLMALAFYTWSAATETLRGTASGRSVAIEFGALLLFGLVVGLLLHRP
jgi:hypothetical protein